LAFKLLGSYSYLIHITSSFEEPNSIQNLSNLRLKFGINSIENDLKGISFYL